MYRHSPVLKYVPRYWRRPRLEIRRELLDEEKKIITDAGRRFAASRTLLVRDFETENFVVGLGCRGGL